MKEKTHVNRQETKARTNNATKPHKLFLQWRHSIYGRVLIVIKKVIDAGHRVWIEWRICKEWFTYY